MNKFELVIFDCDGVLVDSERITCTVLCTMLNELGLQFTLEDVFDLFVGKSMAQDLALITEFLGHPPPADFEAQFRRRQTVALQAGIKPIAGVPAMLDQLHLPFCVASSGRHEKMRLTLGSTGLLDRFAGRIFSVEDVEKPKPSPDVYLLAARTLGVSPEACAVVEDTPTGASAGVAAGMHVFGFAANTPRRKLEQVGVHQIFTDMQELPRLLQ